VLRIDPNRMRADFDALATFGATPAGGVSRPTFSDAHGAARAWFIARAAEEGLEPHVDRAGNHSAVLPASNADAATLLLGSHLDSVPDGGRFDGALGVMAAFEVLRTVQDAGLGLPVRIEAIDFTDEEGTLVGLLGSRALAGTLSTEELGAPRGGRDALVAGLARDGLREDTLLAARREPGSLTGYLELHVEQGPVLEQEGADIGVVTSIVGSRSFQLTFTGAAAHAGTTPMDARRDAGVAAASFVVAARALVIRNHPGCVATVGTIELEPGAFNVVPGVARIGLEFRSGDVAELDVLEAELLALAADQGLDVEVSMVGNWEPTLLDRAVQEAIRGAADELGLRRLDVPSGAGHDAQALATVTRSGMIFVPSRGGVSHHPAEHTDWDDCVNGANVLLGAALRLASA
jgi:beta-ureidopropionase / N-carbamoyl-L-amino-acid hydrolase